MRQLFNAVVMIVLFPLLGLCFIVGVLAYVIEIGYICGYEKMDNFIENINE